MESHAKVESGMWKVIYYCLNAAFTDPTCKTPMLDRSNQVPTTTTPEPVPSLRDVTLSKEVWIPNVNQHYHNNACRLHSAVNKIN